MLVNTLLNLGTLISRRPIIVKPNLCSPNRACFFLFHHHFYFPANFVEGFILSSLLSKSRGSRFLPSFAPALAFVVIPHHPSLQMDALALSATRETW